MTLYTRAGIPFAPTRCLFMIAFIITLLCGYSIVTSISSCGALTAAFLLKCYRLLVVVLNINK